MQKVSGKGARGYMQASSSGGGFTCKPCHQGAKGYMQASSSGGKGLHASLVIRGQRVTCKPRHQGAKGYMQALSSEF